MWLCLCLLMVGLGRVVKLLFDFVALRLVFVVCLFLCLVVYVLFGLFCACMDLVDYCCVAWFVITCELAGGVGGWSLVGMLLWVGWLFVFGILRI